VLHDYRIAAATDSDYRLDIAKASEIDRSCYMGSFFALQHNNRKIIAYDYRIQEETTQGKQEKYLRFLLVSEDQFGLGTRIWASSGRRYLDFSGRSFRLE